MRGQGTSGTSPVCQWVSAERGWKVCIPGTVSLTKLMTKAHFIHMIDHLGLVMKKTTVFRMIDDNIYCCYVQGFAAG